MIRLKRIRLGDDVYVAFLPVERSLFPWVMQSGGGGLLVDLWSDGLFVCVGVVLLRLTEMGSLVGERMYVVVVAWREKGEWNGW